MRKKFLSDAYGVEDSFWDHNWEKSITKNPKVDRTLVKKMKEWMDPGMRILEGGCGAGDYVRYFRSLGYPVRGIDFAKRTVDLLKSQYPEIDVQFGDIGALELPDSSFDAYYSGGVIEHFELGVERQLKEAYRVLKDGGFFFVTVPHINFSRRLSQSILRSRFFIDLDGRNSYVAEKLTKFQSDHAPVGYHFHEYHFSRSEMRSFLHASGFRVVEEMSFSALWGLMDLQWFRRAGGLDKERRRSWHKIITFVTRNVFQIAERKVPIIYNLLAGLFANLRLYVCVCDKPAGS